MAEKPRGWLRRALLIGLGVAATTLGLIGIVVPLLPTTPLLLLAAACFIRSSDRLYRWLISNPVWGRTIQGYREQRAIPLGSKVVTLVVLWGVIGSTALLAVTALWLRLLLAAIALGVTVHLARLKTLPPTSAASSS